MARTFLARTPFGERVTNERSDNAQGEGGMGSSQQHCSGQMHIDGAALDMFGTRRSDRLVFLEGSEEVIVA